MTLFCVINDILKQFLPSTAIDKPNADLQKKSSGTCLSTSIFFERAQKSRWRVTTKAELVTAVRAFGDVYSSKTNIKSSRCQGAWFTDYARIACLLLETNLKNWSIEFPFPNDFPLQEILHDVSNRIQIYFQMLFCDFFCYRPRDFPYHFRKEAKKLLKRKHRAWVWRVIEL